MKESQIINSSPLQKNTTTSINNGLLMIPNQAGYSKINKHKRAGSTGTTGDESYTTDEDDDNLNDLDETDLSSSVSTKNSLTKIINNNNLTNTDFDSFSDIATITDKIANVSMIMHRNSSDSSVYSDIGIDKYDLCDTKNISNSEQWSNSNNKRMLNDFKDETLIQMQTELSNVHQKLKLKDEEVNRLSRIRQDVETELEELTASLFQEAHNMVREANEKQVIAEKALKESQMKVDVLIAEVAALKTLVLTSTPSRPNPHLHPQIDIKSSREECGVAIFTKKHRRSPSHNNLKYGRENSPPDSPLKMNLHLDNIEYKDGLEVDPCVHKEFLNWRETPVLNKNDPFIQRIYNEDINLCLSFNCKELSEKVRNAVENGIILIEAVGDRSKTMFPKKCALLNVPRLCFYRMNIGEPDIWYSISQLCRNRIIAVCDFLNYLKYIERGLVKSSAHDVYWEITRLRKDIVLARLGLNLNS